MTAENSDGYVKEISRAMEVLHNVIDPELFVNIMDLGLVYEINFMEEKKLKIKMTLSTPHCPMGESIVAGVENVLADEFPDREIAVELVWDPEWSMDRITEEGKRQLGIQP
jgi:metal-sulfur cluster biosynthetic enzyme